MIKRFCRKLRDLYLKSSIPRIDDDTWKFPKEAKDKLSLHFLQALHGEAKIAIEEGVSELKLIKNRNFILLSIYLSIWGFIVSLLITQESLIINKVGIHQVCSMLLLIIGSFAVVPILYKMTFPSKTSTPGRFPKSYSKQLTHLANVPETSIEDFQSVKFYQAELVNLQTKISHNERIISAYQTKLKFSYKVTALTYSMIVILILLGFLLPGYLIYSTVTGPISCWIWWWFVFVIIVWLGGFVVIVIKTNKVRKN